MINTLTRAMTLGAAMTAAILIERRARLLAGAQRSAARSHQIAVPLRLHGALLQHSAGRRSLAAMSAEEHGEPCPGLSERREGRRSAGRAEGRIRAGDNRKAEPRRSRRPKPSRPKPPPRRRPRRRSSRPARRSRRSAAPAAPTIPRSARACRPAAPRRCNAWKRTRPSSRPVARRPSPRRPAAQRLAAAQRHPLLARLRLPQARRLPRGGARRDRAAADAAARRTVRAALGLRRRRPHHLRRRGARRRPDRAVPRDQCRAAFAGLSGRAVAVQGAVIARRRSRRSGAVDAHIEYDERKPDATAPSSPPLPCSACRKPPLAQELTAAQRDACMGDYEKYCKSVVPGGGRIIACLAKESDKLRRPARRCWRRRRRNNSKKHGTEDPPRSACIARSASAEPCLNINQQKPGRSTCVLFC